MAQFDVYENGNMETSELYPYLLDVQADILGELPTRIVSARQRISGKKPIPSCSLNWRSRDNGFTCRQPNWPGSAKISWRYKTDSRPRPCEGPVNKVS